MKKLIVLIVVFGLSISIRGLGAKEFKQIDQWNHGDQEIYGYIGMPLITKDREIIVGVARQGCALIAKDRVDLFATMGEGPNQVWLVSASALYGNDIAYIHSGLVIKIFTKKDNTYKESKKRWFKRGYYPPLARDALFTGNKWFLAGLTAQRKGKSGFINALLLVYDDEGKPLKTLIEKELRRRHDFGNMDYYIVADKEAKKRVFLMSEHELKAYEVSTDKLELVKEWVLETPGFYKEMPEDYFMMQKPGDPRSLSSVLAEWKTTYSRISEAAVEDGYLVLQVRTCSKELKKFAMLFYNVDTLKLEKTVFTDGFFIGARDGKYYFYHNGNPGRDEGVDECIIDVYAFEGK